ncbi:outer membrane protein assembly factor BamC [Pseudaquabacterium pictum]|uniref:outer membrane protein assembly factor BamC n=1 Tax=Pseudaquabacterium pictum TaxID=2315236 RepID=UPI0010F94809|nr:outer membrane protein assembly factor BamC [Rubrivivax pictus]
MRATTPLLALCLALSLAGCSSFENLMSGDKVDYRGGSQKTAPLEVPPDLSQLAREGRYQPQTGVVSATTLRQPNAPQQAAPTVVAPNTVADMRIERQGNTRWLVSSLPPEKLYPLIRSFWQERGFSLAVDNPEIGLMETDWAENRAKIPQDVLRRTLGRVIENLYSTPERDRFRTRIERTANGSEVYISHRGVQEIYTSELKDATVWQPRPSDPELEVEFLSRLMVKLGAKEETARPTVAAAPAAPAKARVTTIPATAAMEIDEGFDRAWRQVGLALDRSGFTVEDRDRSAGIYFVRYVDPKLAGKDEPGFFSKLFGGDKEAARPQRVRVLVKASGAKSQVTVQTADGNPDNSPQARTIVGKLIDELK